MSDVLLAQKWENEDPTGWWISEKLDGVRALWRNGSFSSRGDNTFACPDWFKKKMPSGCILDGELWGGRGQFQKTVGIVRNSSRGKEWEFVSFMVFDCLQEGGKNIESQPFEARLEAVKRLCSSAASGDAVLKPVPMERCANRDHLSKSLAEVETCGGEGLMLRCPGSKYEHRRSKSLLKVKTFHDEEAIVVGHEGGTGRVSGMCGALLCETPDKRRFKVGSGLDDAQRRDPPPVNSVITYRYQELTAANIPRFPTLVGERTDMTWAQICSTYVPPGPRTVSQMKKKHSILFDEAGATTAAAPATDAASSSADTGRGLKRGLSGMDAMQLGTATEDLDDFGFDDLMPPSVAEPPAKKLRVSEPSHDVAGKPACPFGRKCYRKNPAHFTEFAHPWLDQENESATSPLDPPAVAAATVSTPSGDGASSSCDSKRVSAASSTSKGGPSFAEAAASIFDADTLPAHMAVPEVAEAQLATSEKKIPTEDAVKAPEPDVRIVAVRNLLASMLQDAADKSLSEHLSKMLELAESVPLNVSGGAAPSVQALEGPKAFAALPAPTPSVQALTGPQASAALLAPAPSVQGLEGPHAPAPLPPPSRSPPRSLASALLSCDNIAQSTLEVAAPNKSTTPPAAEAPIRRPARNVPPEVPLASTGPKAKLAEELAKMGFPADGIKEALQHCSTADESVDWLLARAT
eukprot:TRINITY_DN34983_c0_g1_i1.p1 TRINITY_DN34983_c0_g1~~TRINITY_DN34983_c0_g1_i1.p1  ORF type:complete len:692 (-),score=162.13 TRINITY_DN34983_c0_g1_i1:290-2365(-)